MKGKKMKVEVINANAAGIDVGSRSHYVAIGQEIGDVREFGVYDEDLKSLVVWLKEEGIETVAMESTGSYWQNLYNEIELNGIEVVLANGKFTKNAKGKKTDVKDARWIQHLHTLGILSGSFLPDGETEKLRTYCRHRTNLIQSKADTSRKMQKYLKLLNFRLDVAVSDVTGKTGIKIISEICKGNLDSKELSKHRHFNCRKPESEIEKALRSNERTDFLFGLKQEYARYKFYLELIAECDGEIKIFLEDYMERKEEVVDDLPEKKPYKRNNKNGIKTIDLNIVSYQYFDGIDLFSIPGVSHSTVLTIMSEIGIEGFDKFKTSKQFASWLRLAPNNKISGGRILSNRVPKGSNRMKIALRSSANAIGKLKGTHLANFFKRVLIKKGRQSAITATARKLAVIIWNMMVKGQQYDPQEEYLFLDQKRKIISMMKRNMSKFDITAEDVGLFTKQNYLAAIAKNPTGNQ